MNMQGTARQNYRAQSGTLYTADANGVVSSVANGDVLSLLNMGCVPIDSVMSTMNVPLWSGRNADGSVLAASAAAGKFGQVVTLGSVLTLISEAASSNSKTSTALFAIQLPLDYTAGADITVGVDQIQEGGAATVKTLDVLAYRADGLGALGADICATAIQNMTTSRSRLDFVITGTTLAPGDIVIVKIVTVLTEAAAGSVTNSVNGITVF